MALHVNGDVLFTAGIGQTCALRRPKELTNPASAAAKPAEVDGPGAKFLLQNAVNKLSGILFSRATASSEIQVPELIRRRSNRPAPPAGL
ncbi:hypothetical protein Q5P01_005861 [Channa striata]|uniref:Uncharacterized protein n=1 Tax=Channa striata TaxID=64152 RepID=A0AA88T3G5_CHASR|nr:hypothetical protein Q5P01_005861 [Channa striata]